MIKTLLAVLLLAGSVPARAAPPESSETMRLTRSAVTAGGGATSASDSHRLTLTIGEEVTASTAASATRVVRPGLGHIFSYPGPVTDLDARADVSRTSMTLTWTAPGYDGGLVDLQAGTSYFIRIASYTVPDTFVFQRAQLILDASGDPPGAAVDAGATGLAPNTTWYLGLWTTDWTGNISTASARGAASTLADPPIFVASPFLEVFSASVTVRWAALPASPSSSTSEGYVVEASSTDFGALSPGGVIYSSATSDVLVTTLTVSEPALTTDKLYYFRVASLNWQGRPNYIALGSVMTAFEAQPPIPADPAFTDLSTGSLVVRWDRNGNPLFTSYQLDASLSSGFSEYSSSTTFNLFAATGTLSPNTTYFFRVNATTDTSSSLFAGLGSTMTLAYTPASAPSTFSDVGPHVMTLSWLTGGNPVDLSSYTVVLSTEAFFPNVSEGNLAMSTSPAGALPTATLAALPNTTYYAFVAALNSVGAPSPYRALGSTLTSAALPLAAVPGFADNGQTSFTAIWDPDGNPLAVTTFTVEASTSPAFDAGTQFSVAFDTVPAGPAATFTGLEPNTVYFFRLRARDFRGIETAYAELGSTSTLPSPPSLLNFDAVEPTPAAIQIDWSAGSNGPGTGFRANVSTSAVFGAGAAVTTHTVFTAFLSTAGLVVNTTYYFRVAAIGNDGSLSSFVAASTPTRANTPAAAAETFASGGQSSFTALWGRNGNHISITTYTVHVSSAPDFNEGVFDEVHFATMPAGAAPAASFSGLNPAVTYYFRVDALNHVGSASPYAVLGATSTKALAPATPSAAADSVSSMTVTWTPVAAAGYEVRASSTDFGALLPGGAVYLSSGAGSSLASLGLTGLTANTSYYLRVGAYDWGDNATVALAGPVATLAAPVTQASVFRAYATSATVNWTPRPASPQASTAEGYILEASTAASVASPSDFTGVIFSSVSYGVQPATLTVSGLDPGSTYTLRVGALNWADRPDYAVAGTTVTPISNFVWSLGASGQWNTAGNWTPNGVPSAGSRVLIDDNVTVTASGNGIRFFELTLGDTAGTFSPVLLVSTAINNGVNMTVHKNATFTQNVNQALTFSGDVSFLQGSVLTHSLIGTVPQSRSVHLEVAGTFTMQAGATAAVSGLGFNGGAVNGGSGLVLNNGGGIGNSASSAGGSGAGHGGGGGAAGINAGGATYDSLTDPALAGSGGGGGDSTGSGVGGKGGGVVRVNAGSMVFDGIILATGAVGGGGGVSSTFRGAGGGGAGGSVKLSADYFVGTGSITVLGGDGGADVNGLDDPGGGGGGGRVAVSAALSGSICDLTVTLTGGASGGGTSGAGSDGTYSSTSSFQAPASFSGVSPTSATLQWTWNLSDYGKNYQVFASTGGAVSPVLGPAEVQYLETGLLANTTYTRFVRVTGCGNGANSSLASRSTLASPPTALAESFTEVQTDNIAAAWQAFPASPLDQSAEGYVLEASSTNFGALSPGGVVTSSQTYGVAQSTLAALYPFLETNTTYYFRVAALNWAGELSSYTALGSTSTLALAPTRLAEDFLSVYAASVTVQWAALAASPQSQTAEGYVVEASSTNFGLLTPGGVVSSSATANAAVSSLTVFDPALITNHFYYFRVGALNWNGVANYTHVGSTLTPLEMQTPLPDDPLFTGISSGSIVAHWLLSGNPDSTRYRMDVSLDPGFSSYSSSGTFALFEATSTLSANTEYHFRVQASSVLSVSPFALFGSTVTHAFTPAAAGTAFTGVTAHQMTISWLPGGNPEDTTIYAAVASTSPAYPNTDAANVALTTTPAGVLPTATLAVTPNTTYYVFVTALNSVGAQSRALEAGVVLTPAATPLTAAPAFAGVSDVGFTAIWNGDGNPLAVTTYTVEASTSPTFDAGTFDSVAFDTAPASPSATFATLNANTTYFVRVRARDHQSSVTAYTELGSTTTHAGAPVPSVTGVFLSSLTVSWTPVAAASYELRASSTNFGALLPGGPVAFSSVTGGSNSSLPAQGLSLNTTYYLRLTAYNWSGHPTLVEPSSHSTLAQAVSGAMVYQAYATSVTVNWLPRPASPQAATVEGYIVEASTAASIVAPSDFTGVIFSSISYGIQPATLTVTGLDAGATYTLRVGALNWSDEPSYAAAGTTVTLVSDFAWIAGSGLWNTATNWSPNGIPSAGSRVTIDANATVTASVTAIRFFTLTLGDPAGTFAPVLVLSTSIAAARNMTVHKNATFTSGVVSTHAFTGDVSFLQGSLLNHSANTTSPQTSALNFQVAGTFALQAGATAAVSGRGFNGGAANGGIGVIIGGGGGNGSAASSSGGSGAGHGGQGGVAGPNAAGVTYDSLTEPALAGSGGGGGDTSGAGGKGGGVVTVSAQTLEVNGLISADGAAGAAGTGGNVNAGAGGGGSGGSVRLSADYLVGTGTITVLGGGGGTDTDAGNDPGGGGGGGRAAVSAAVSGSVCDLTVTLTGGASGGGTSGAGSDGTFDSASSFLAPASFAGVSPTSATLQWTWSLSANGKNYQVFASTGGAVSPVLGPAVVQYSETGLLANTTYTRYVRVSGCGAGADSAVASLATLTSPPTALAQSFPAVEAGSVSAAWAAFPASPQEAGAEGYRLEASTAADFTGTMSVADGADIAVSTLAVSGLLPNTTYFFRAAALNWAGALSSYTALGSTATLALPPVALGESFLMVGLASATANWAAFAESPPEASSASAQGYVLQASSTNFGALTPGGAVYSSTTWNVLSSTLTIDVSPAHLCAPHYFRAASLNWNGAPNYTVIGSTRAEDYAVVVSTQDLDIGLLDLDTEIVISTSLLVSNIGCPVTYQIKVTTITPGSPWAVSTTSGTDAYTLQALFSTAQPASVSFADIDKLSDAAATATTTKFAGNQNGADVPVTEDRLLWFKLGMPRFTSTEESQQIRVTVYAIPP